MGSIKCILELTSYHYFIHHCELSLHGKHNTKDTVYCLMMQQYAVRVMNVMVSRSEYCE